MGERSFFVLAAAIQGDRAELQGQLAHQIRAVLRLQPGDEIELLDNAGWAYSARLTEVGKSRVAAALEGRHRPETEPRVRLELFQALLKGQKMDLVLQKGTELGVARFVPMLSERCVSRPTAGEIGRKIERWESVVREAAEQSGRAILPSVEQAEPFRAACESAARADLGLFAWEREHSGGIGESLVAAGLGAEAALHAPPIPSGDEPQARPTIALLIGPEGGFSPAEAAFAKESGLRAVSLGPRILRAETAALAAVTLVLCRTGDLGG